jgi:hypothetical protein
MATKEGKNEIDFNRVESASTGNALVVVPGGPSDTDVFITVPASISDPREVEVV